MSFKGRIPQLGRPAFGALEDLRITSFSRHPNAALIITQAGRGMRRSDKCLRSALATSSADRLCGWAIGSSLVCSYSCCSVRWITQAECRRAGVEPVRAR